jgi:hypothetical protein
LPTIPRHGVNTVDAPLQERVKSRKNCIVFISVIENPPKLDILLSRATFIPPQHDRCCRRRHERHERIQERSGLEIYTVSCAISSFLPRRRATSSRRVGFGRCSPSTTSTTPRTSPFPNPRGPLVSVSSRSGRIQKFLPQLRVYVFRLVTMMRIWCTRSLGRLNLLDFLLRHNALVGGHPGPRKKKTDE